MCALDADAVPGAGVRLDRLRGAGAWFAFASPALMVASVVYLIVILGSVRLTPDQAPPVWFPWALGLGLILVGVAVLSGLVVAIDLELIEHPLTHSGLTYLALAAAAVGTLAFLTVMLMAVLNVPSQFGQLLLVLMFLGFGAYLTLINLGGRRAGLVTGWLSVAGIVSGALFLLGGIMVGLGQFIGVVLTAPALIGYLIWSTGLGLVLRRRRPGAQPSLSLDM